MFGTTTDVIFCKIYSFENRISATEFTQQSLLDKQKKQFSKESEQGLYQIICNNKRCY